MDEKTTRRKLIDVQLRRAGWSGADLGVLEEVRLHKGSPNSREPRPDRPTAADEIVDCILYDGTGLPIAIVEAKRTCRHALDAERQAADYADEIRRLHGVDPFIFLTNGNEVWFGHRHRHPPRRVSGFFHLDDLERLAFQDRYRDPLSRADIGDTIVDRQYQHQAIRAVTGFLEKAQRRFLLVMATGTGKT